MNRKINLLVMVLFTFLMCIDKYIIFNRAYNHGQWRSSKTQKQVLLIHHLDIMPLLAGATEGNWYIIGGAGVGVA